MVASIMTSTVKSYNAIVEEKDGVMKTTPVMAAPVTQSEQKAKIKALQNEVKEAKKNMKEQANQTKTNP